MKKTIGFIGLGVMGKSMASHILNDGHPVLVYTRTKEKAESILQKGAIWKDTVKDLSKEADVIITMVGYPSDVEEVYFGSNGIIENAKEGAYLIDMTTSKPSLAKKIAEAGERKSIVRFRRSCFRWRHRCTKRNTRDYGRWRKRSF